MSPISVREVLARAAGVLRRSGVDSARLDAEVLLAHVMRTSRTGLYMKSEGCLTDSQLNKFTELIDRRLQREPVSYLTGEKEFMSLEFRVTRDVLIPRPETEILVEWVIKKVEKLLLSNNNTIILDVGTGSGAIAVSLAKYVPLVKVWALDVSEKALALARENAQRMSVGHRIEFLCSDLLTGIPPGLKGGVDFIVANLPYIPSADIPHLQAEVKFEPVTALDGGGDGLDLYRRLIPQARDVLKTGGWLGMEMGISQTKALASLLPDSCWGGGVQVLKDYAGLDRFIVAGRKTS